MATAEARIAALETGIKATDDRADRHETDCGERYRDLNAQLTRIHARIDTLLIAAWTGVVAAMATMATAVFQLLQHH